LKRELKNMSEKKTIEALIDGGKATAGPPLGPALGPLGVNVLQIVNEINDLTKSYAGMKVPVKIIIDVETKSFEVEVGTPTTSALIVKELGIEKGSGTAGTESVGNLSKEQVINIAQSKIKDSFANTLKSMVKEVLGTCVSMGVTVEDNDPREIQKNIDNGEWDELLKASG
jgi:large subunit ribosomal protein L11